MKKMVLAGVLSLATATSIAADFKPIFLGEDFIRFVGADSSGRYYVNKGSGFRVIDFGNEILLDEATTNAESLLSASLPSYQVGFFSNYPKPPANINEYPMLGVSSETTDQEYLAIATSYLNTAKSVVRGNRTVYSTTENYNVLEVRGNRILINNGVAGTNGSIVYNCDINDFDFSQGIEKNLESCISTPYAYTANNLGYARSGMYAAINSKGVAVVRSSSDENEFKLIDPESRTVISRVVGSKISSLPSGITVSDDEDPYIYINNGSKSDVYRYKNGEIKSVETTESAFFIGGNPLPDLQILGSTKNSLVFQNSNFNSLYMCDKESGNSESISYYQYVQGYAKAIDEAARPLISNYPNKPDNYEEIVTSLGLEADFPLDIENSSYRGLIDRLLTPGFEEAKIKKLEIMGCKSGTLKTIDANASGLLVSEDSDNEILFYKKNIKKEPLNSTLIISYDLNKENKKYLSRNIVESIGLNDVLMLKSISSLEHEYEWLDFNNINFPADFSDLELIEDITLSEFSAYLYDLVLSHFPLGNKSATDENNNYQNPISVEFFDGKIFTNSGVLTLSPAAVVALEVEVNPKDLTIDPYTNPISSIDIVTDGELFAADVSCTVAGPIDITSADYGNWGGSERLTLPLQWTSKDAKGVVSLKGDVDSVSGEQQLLVLDTLAEVTTADVTVNCAATVSDKNGNQLNVNLIPATIRLDDGIHGGSGVITGQVTLPAGVNSEDVTVEVTINGRTIRLNVDENGRFEFDELRDGDFTINVKSEHYTQSCINTQTTGSQIDLGNIELIAGDVNNDGEINIADFTYLAGRYGSTKGDERYTIQADLNSDDKVNIQDLAILGSHFGSRQCNQ